jgi:tetratricopeptide (TPR) repeat protein/tRNA A-37 threonylcarbamoyl transferase component Bud32
MPPDPQSPLPHDDETLRPGSAPPPAAPSDSAPGSTVNPSPYDQTLAPPGKPNPHFHSESDAANDATLKTPRGPTPRSPQDVTAKFDPQATLAPSPDATLIPAKPREAAPSDATLDPDDPQAVAYQKAIERTPGIMHTSSFGDYELISPIAKGGMGVVYKARQRKLNRIVAIKMILAGQFADQTDVDRFYQEAEAAAALSHPNIVGIYEIGEVSGQHFFSMEYIDGDSLAGMVRESPFTPERAARFVKTIAETMHFAHERGIVHRDLKPSNVLVDSHQRALITDFGLAKSVSNQSQLTMSGAIVGTPSYMPPEQASGDADRVGPCSDIYSTGAVLYELLTGRPPFRAATPFETVRQVMENEPLSPRLVNPGVPRDLETICLKCLQKDPGKRYPTSQELADELGRYLNGEPIKARPVGRVERVWRWCKRNKPIAAAIAVSTLLLLLAITSISVAYVRTSSALAKSEESLREAMAAVNDYMTIVSEDKLLQQGNFQGMRRELLEKALVYYQRFLKQRGNDPSVRDELASAYYRVGLITEDLESTDRALPALEMARDMQAQLLLAQPQNAGRLLDYGNTLNALGRSLVRQKKYAQSLKYFQQAIEIRQRLCATDDQNAEYQRLLANGQMNLGIVEIEQRQLDQAREHLLAAQKTRNAALALDPDNKKLREDIAKAEFNLGNLEWFAANAAARLHFEKAAQDFEKLLERDPDNLDYRLSLARCQRSLGEVLQTTAPEEALQQFQLALRQLEPLATQNPLVQEFQSDLAGVHMTIGYLYRDIATDDATLSRNAFLKALAINESLHQKHPSFPRFRFDLAITLRELALEQDFTGDNLSARESLKRAIGMLTELVAEYPKDQKYQRELDATQQYLAEISGSASPPEDPVK